MSGRGVLGSRSPFTASGDLGFHEGFVHIAPQPVLAGIFGACYRVTGLVGVPVGLLVLRGVATVDLAARHASPQGDPRVAHILSHPLRRLCSRRSLLSPLSAIAPFAALDAKSLR